MANTEIKIIQAGHGFMPGLNDVTWRPRGQPDSLSVANRKPQQYQYLGGERI